MGRIVVFGATGYTGGLVAEALVAAGVGPVVAGRSAERLAALTDRLGPGLETAVADVQRPASVRALVEAGDVLLTTVGPFAEHGAVSVAAALDAGSHYVDSTGEAPFIRRVFEEWGPRASGALLTAFGYDYVPGNLAGALAARELSGATRVDVGYFLSGAGGPSSGTRASAIGLAFEQHHALRDGLLVRERPGRSVRSFPVGGQARPALSIGGSEPYALTRGAPGLQDVCVYLGWFGAAARPIAAGALGAAALGRLPGARAALRLGTAALRRGSGGPSAEVRDARRTQVVAVARDGAGREAVVELHGPDPYDLTARLMGWAATRLADGVVTARGALGPVDAFGLDALEAACAAAGLHRV